MPQESKTRRFMSKMKNTWRGLTSAKVSINFNVVEFYDAQVERDYKTFNINSKLFGFCINFHTKTFPIIYHSGNELSSLNSSQRMSTSLVLTRRRGMSMTNSHTTDAASLREICSTRFVD